MDFQIINSISNSKAQSFGDFILGKLQHTIENPLSIILDPINQSSRETVDSISRNIGVIAGSENKRGLAALNEQAGGFIDNTFNNISPGVLILGGIGAVAILVIALKV
jgi:hypothetical protein